MLFQNGRCPKCGAHASQISIEANPGPVRGADILLVNLEQVADSESRHKASSATEESTMAQTQMYRGKAVSIVRDVKSGDADFVQGQDEIVIRLDNGTEKKGRALRGDHGQFVTYTTWRWRIARHVRELYEAIMIEVAHASRPGRFSCHRQAEWTTAVALLGLGMQFLFFPIIISNTMFRDVLMIASPGTVMVLLIVISWTRIIVLVLNGSIPFYGPILRSICAGLTGIVWLQMWLSLLRLDPELPRPVTTPIFIALMLTDFLSAYRAASDVRG